MLSAKHNNGCLSSVFSQRLVWLLPLFLHADQRPVLRQLGHQSHPLQPGFGHLPPDLLLHGALLLLTLPPYTQEAPPPANPPLHQHLQQPHPLHQHHQRDGVLIGLQWNTLSHTINPSAATLWLLVRLHQGNYGTGLETVDIQYWDHHHFIVWGQVPTLRPLWFHFRCTFYDVLLCVVYLFI